MGKTVEFLVSIRISEEVAAEFGDISVPEEVAWRFLDDLQNEYSRADVEFEMLEAISDYL